MKKALIIINPLSGGKNKKNVAEIISGTIDKSLIEPVIVYTEAPGHATSLAQETDAEIVVAVGGDGTVSEVGQALIGTEKALGIVPCGSGDGLALHLGISRNIRRAVETVNGLNIVCIDHGRVNGHPFFCTTGVGLDAMVAWKFARAGSRGLQTYIRKALQTVRDYTPDIYTIDVDGSILTTPAMLVTVGNAAQWGNQAKIAPLASVTDGYLDVTIVKPFYNAEIPILATILMDGRAYMSPRVMLMRGKKVVIHRTKDEPAHFDGDPCQLGRILDIDIVPSSLNVIAPRDKKI